MFVILMLITVLAAVILLVVLVSNLTKIIDYLNAIGGNPDSYLSKLRLGLRAIETETGHIATEVTTLNAELGVIAEGLTGVDQHLVNTINSVVKQKRG
tara:strand:- start:365 stop:658 length:294 start_codon:yes stop_codon:yes gene_type:complete